MRPLLIGLCLFSGVAAFGQQQVDREKLKKNHSNGTWETNAAKPLSGRWRQWTPGNGIYKPQLTLPKGTPPGVYALALDRMPCVVPHTQDIVSIPNPGLNYKPPTGGRMPNKTLRGPVEVIVAPVR